MVYFRPLPSWTRTRTWKTCWRNSETTDSISTTTIFDRPLLTQTGTHLRDLLVGIHSPWNWKRRRFSRGQFCDHAASFEGRQTAKDRQKWTESHFSGTSFGKGLFFNEDNWRCEEIYSIWWSNFQDPFDDIAAPEPDIPPLKHEVCILFGGIEWSSSCRPIPKWMMRQAFTRTVGIERLRLHLRQRKSRNRNQGELSSFWCDLFDCNLVDIRYAMRENECLWSICSLSKIFTFTNE